MPRGAKKDGPPEQVMVYKFGTGASVRLPDEAMEQLRLAHRMRNRLVEAELANDANVADAYATYKPLAEIDARLAAADAEAEALAARARKEHSQDRKLATRTDTAVALAEVRGRIKVLRQERKPIFVQAKKVVKPVVVAIREEHEVLKNRIRQEYAAAGLYWGTYNAVLDSHRLAIGRVIQNRKAGLASELHFSRWEGSGSLTVQLQRSSAEPVRSPAVVASGDGKYRNVLHLPKIDADPDTVAAMTDAQRKNSGADRATMRWSIGGAAGFELPVTVHRPLPADADITGAKLVQRMIGGKPHISVSVIFKRPMPAPAQGHTVALHMGWRTRPDGSVRVGTWASTVPLRRPEAALRDAATRADSRNQQRRRKLADAGIDLHDGLRQAVVPQGDGRWGEIVFPAGWIEYASYPDVLHAIRDKNTAPVVEALAVWLDEHPQPGLFGDDKPLTGAVVRRWRSPARFAALAWRWRTEPPSDDGAAEVVAALEEWRHHDKHLWTWEANQREHAGRRRDDVWAQVAFWLTRGAGVLVTDDADLRAMLSREDEAETDPVMPAAVQERSRNRARIVAPGGLRQRARVTAGRDVLRVVEVSAVDLSRRCPLCDHVDDVGQRRRAASATVWCPGCGGEYDQDRAAVERMLSRVSV